jgi:mono/diheme cytochrome c family protein
MTPNNLEPNRRQARPALPPLVGFVLAMATSLVADEARNHDLHLYLKGRHLYQRRCQECHGATGRGDGSWADELETRPRNFRSGIYKFRTTAYGTLPTDEDLRRTIRSGISGTAMPIFAHLHDEDIDALVTYLKHLSKRWRDPAAAPVPVPIPEVPAWFGTEDEADHALAAEARYASLCASCHGERGKGDGPAAKGLADVWGRSIAPAVLAAPHHKSGDSPKDLYRSIATGLDGTPMVGFGELLEEQEIWELVAWIRAKGATDGAE